MHIQCKYFLICHVYKNINICHPSLCNLYRAIKAEPLSVGYRWDVNALIFSTINYVQFRVTKKSI